MIIEMTYALLANEHVIVGQIITVKPENSVWKAAELSGMGFTTFDLTESTRDDLTQNLTDRKVDDTTTPTAIVSMT